MFKSQRVLFAFLFSLVIVFPYASRGQVYEPTWSSIDKREVPQWFADAKFGIFIHWGIYSVPAWAPANEDIGVYAKYAEWYWQRINNGQDPNKQKVDVNKLFVDHHTRTYGENFKYQDFAPMFRAQEFKADEWADLFLNAGAKYVVLTSKHHEGFTLWPSRESWNWNSVDIGPHKDLCKEVAAAVKARGLHMGFYYSLYEWFNPLYGSDSSRYVSDHMIPQLKDLVTSYEPDLIYTDGEWEHTSSLWQSEKFLAWLYNESTVRRSVVVNDRWGKDTRSRHGGYFTSEYGITKDDEKIGTYTARPWEEIRGIGTSFGYNHVENLNNYLSSQELIHLLVDVVSRGGNLCLNVGPTADGRIPVIMQERLNDIGNWLSVNGEAIYGSKPWDKAGSNPQSPGVFYTTNKGNLYVIATAFPDEKIEVNGVSGEAKVSLLGSSEKIPSKISNGTLTLLPPSTASLKHLVHAWVFKVEGVK